MSIQANLNALNITLAVAKPTPFQMNRAAPNLIALSII